MSDNIQLGPAIPMVVGPIVKTKEKGPCKCFHDVSFRTAAESDMFKAGVIRFRNYYCATLTIKQLYTDETASKERWRTVLSETKLMQDPHYEDDAQAWHYIKISDFKQSSFVPDVRLPFRFYVSQPSPHWRRFELRDIMFFENSKEDKINRRRRKSSKLLRTSLRGASEVASSTVSDAVRSDGLETESNSDSGNNIILFGENPGIRRLLALEVRSQTLSKMINEFTTSGDSRNNPISCLSFEHGHMSTVAIEAPILHHSYK